VLASLLPPLLLCLAMVNLLTGQQRAAAVIAVMVVLSSLLTFVQEHRSDQAAAKLRTLVRTTVTVLRPHRRIAAGGEIRRGRGRHASGAPRSAVVSGSANAMVVATGAGTSFGAIASAAAEAREQTSFDRGVDRFVALMPRAMHPAVRDGSR
jgi:Mg2+-importing ATPase